MLKTDKYKYVPLGAQRS